MSNLQLKADIDQFLQQVEDPTLLRAIRAMLSDYVADQLSSGVVGYEADGTPIDGAVAGKQYQERLQRMREGREMSLEDLKRNAATWCLNH